jgi:hypothetical protein
VSGTIAFTAAGDRATPRYTVLNMDAVSRWTEVGSIGLTADTADIDGSKICWAAEGCDIDSPSDRTFQQYFMLKTFHEIL